MIVSIYLCAPIAFGADKVDATSALEDPPNSLKKPSEFFIALEVLGTMQSLVPSGPTNASADFAESS